MELLTMEELLISEEYIEYEKIVEAMSKEDDYNIEDY